MANARDVKEDIEAGDSASIQLWFRAELRATTELKISVSVRGKEETVPAISLWEGDDVKTCALNIDIPKADCAFARAFAEDGTVAVEVTWMKVVEQGDGREGDGGHMGKETESKEPEEQRASAVLHLQKLLVGPRELSKKLVGDGFTITFGTNSDILSSDVRAFLLPCALDAECKSLPPSTTTTLAAHTSISAIESITFPGGPTRDYKGHPIIFFVGTWNKATLRSNVQTHRCIARTYHGEATFLLSDLLRIKKWSDKQTIVPKLPPVTDTSTRWDIEQLFADTAGHLQGAQQAAHSYVEKYLDTQSTVRLSVEGYRSLARDDACDDDYCEDSVDSEPFGRIVVLFAGSSKKLVLAAKKLVAHALRSNTVVMKMEHGPSRAIATRQMTQNEKEDYTLNVFTGFCLHCDNAGARIVCIEGIKNSDEFKELGCFARKLSNTRGHNARIKVLQHDKVSFDRRLYGDFDFVIKQITLREPLDDLCHRADLFNPRKTDVDVSRGLHKVMEMKQGDRLATLKMNQSFPLAQELVAMETFVGNFVTDAELFGHDDTCGASTVKSQKGSRGTNAPRSPERGVWNTNAMPSSTNTFDQGRHEQQGLPSVRESSSRASGRAESCGMTAASTTPSEPESKRTTATALRALQVSRAETMGGSRIDGSDDLSPASVRFKKACAESQASSATLLAVTEGLHERRRTDCHNSDFDRRLNQRGAHAPTDRIRANIEHVRQLSARTAATTPRTLIDVSFLPPEGDIHIYSTQTRNTVAQQLAHVRNTLDPRKLYASVDGTTFCPVNLSKKNNYFLRQEDETLRRTDAPEFQYPRAKDPSEFVKHAKDVSAARKEDLRAPWVEDKNPHTKQKPIRGRFDSRTLALTKPRVAEVPPRNINPTLTELQNIAVEGRKKWHSKVVVKKTTMSFAKHSGALDSILQDAPVKLGVRFTARAGGEVHNVEPHLKPLSSETPFTDYRLNSSLVTPFARIVMKPSTKPNIVAHATPREKRFITPLSDEDRQRFPPRTARF